MSEYNCACEAQVIVEKFGVERCASCGKLAGASIMVPIGAPLPTKTRKRRAVKDLVRA